MRSVFRFIAYFVLAFMGALLVAGLVGYLESERKINATYDIAAAGLSIPTDTASITEGQRLVAIRGCPDCHTGDLGGGLFFDGGPMGTYHAANITPGQGSAVAAYTADDWERAIRHGVEPEGTGILLMPSNDYAGLSNEDTARMIAYLQTVPPVDRSVPDSTVGPLGRLLVGFGVFPLPASLIDHDAPPPERVTAEVSPAFGAYLATSCIGCHQPDFSGGPVPGAQPGDPPAANLTLSGNPGNWTEEQFIETLRTGITPEGRVLDPAQMPWPVGAQMTDVELKALWAYLQSLPPAG
jgi:mono/diheme cytochrome c family protein